MTRGSGTGTTRSSMCRTPWKIPYDTQRQAVQANREHGRKLPCHLRPYHCACGRWHLTHLTKRQAKQIARRRNMAA